MTAWLGTACDSPAPALMNLSKGSAAPQAPARAVVEPPVVTLDGSSHGNSVTLLGDGGERIYSIAARTWVYAAPNASSDRLGYLRAGSSAPVNGEVAGTDRCSKGWYPILPKGFVCAGPDATLDRKHPIVRATEALLPNFSRKLPYMYGTVRKPGPIYARLPEEQELLEVEPDLPKRMEQWFAAGGEVGASFAQHVWLGGEGVPPDPEQAYVDRVTAGVPSYLSNGQVLPNLLRKPRNSGQLVIERMEPKVGYAFLETFFWKGRRYGVTTEMKLMPTDRFRPIQGSDFHGFEIGKDVKFPFAIVRSPAARFRDGSKATYRAILQLTGKKQFFNKVLHYETQDGKWIGDRDASWLDAVKKMPAWGINGEKWIDVNITKQTLVLYEGQKPVFATLVSTGEAGLENAEHTTATKRGIFRIHTKHVTTTMSSNELGEEFELQDVPYVQYFDQGGYALHGAYWHDRFGVPKSHGCINLSPEDARRIFFWTEPAVPQGWHGALLPLRGTVMFIHP
ncbi:MAG TPA: L,D-transpeptidase [Polyangiaceae bacterium]|nr:L,D-transpeptidase [Polyangiaceae bacterium]